MMMVVLVYMLLLLVPQGAAIQLGTPQTQFVHGKDLNEHERSYYEILVEPRID